MLDEIGSISDDSSDMVAGEASSSRPDERTTKCEGGRRPLRVGCALLPKKVCKRHVIANAVQQCPVRHPLDTVVVSWYHISTQVVIVDPAGLTLPDA